jgi:hypothetical protein
LGHGYGQIGGDKDNHRSHTLFSGSSNDQVYIQSLDSKQGHVDRSTSPYQSSTSYTTIMHRVELHTLLSLAGQTK